MLRKDTKFLVLLKKKKNLLYNKYLRAKQALMVFAEERDWNAKILPLVGLVINVPFTGLLIWYVIEHRNFVSYGILSALVMYYVEWLVQLIKSK